MDSNLNGIYTGRGSVAVSAADGEARSEASAGVAARSRVDDLLVTVRDPSLGEMTPDQAAALANIVGQMFKTLQNIVKNIAPSEREVELLKRRIEELKQLQHDLTDRKIDEELARKTLANILADEVVTKFLPPLDWSAPIKA